MCPIVGHTCIKIIRIRYLCDIQTLAFGWSFVYYIKNKSGVHIVFCDYLKFLFNFSDIDECISKPCDTNATCANFVGLYNCTCKKGFTGDETTNCTGDLITEN